VGEINLTFSKDLKIMKKIRELIKETGYESHELLTNSRDITKTALDWAKVATAGLWWSEKEGDTLMWPQDKEEILDQFSKFKKL
jgi:hypothetical protein